MVVSIAHGLGDKPQSFLELADTGKDHNKLHISETYCLKSIQITVKPPPMQPNLIYDYGICNHVFSDREASVRVQAKDGWLRVETTKVPPERRKWKCGKRDHEPEVEAGSLDKLRRRLHAQLHAGSMPTRSCRRQSIAARGNKMVATKAKQRAKSQRVTAACKALREQA